MTSILHVQDTDLDNPQSCLTGEIKFKIYSPHSLREKMRMEKTIGTVVCDVFNGERFQGEVRSVIFHEIHAEYMYHD